MAEEVIWTTEEDIRAERELLRRWREDEDRFWTYLRRYATNRRRNEESLRRFQHELESLRQIGWAYLTGFQRTRYLRLRDFYIPNAEARIKSWTTETDRIIKSIYTIRDKITREENRLRRKKPRPPPPKNKLVAIHKRWFYKSPRGRYHDISIEAVASIIIPATERKEDYETILIDTLEEHMFSEPGFEQLTELQERVEGFEEKPTDKPTRDIKFETLEWWHKVFRKAQLKITDFMVE
jgi:hypothetical protein